MSKAQRCESVMRRYRDSYDVGGVQRGCFDATIHELERQEQEILELRKDAARYRWLRIQHEGEPLYEGAQWPDFTDSTEISFCVFMPVNDMLEPIGCIPGELDEAIDTAITAAQEGK